MRRVIALCETGLSHGLLDRAAAMARFKNRGRQYSRFKQTARATPEGQRLKQRDESRKKFASTKAAVGRGVKHAASVAGSLAVGAGLYKGAKYLHGKYKQWRGRESLTLREMSYGKIERKLRGEMGRNQNLHSMAFSSDTADAKDTSNKLSKRFGKLSRLKTRIDKKIDQKVKAGINAHRPPPAATPSSATGAQLDANRKLEKSRSMSGAGKLAHMSAASRQSYNATMAKVKQPSSAGAPPTKISGPSKPRKPMGAVGKALTVAGGAATLYGVGKAAKYLHGKYKQWRGNSMESTFHRPIRVVAIQEGVFGAAGEAIKGAAKKIGLSKALHGIKKTRKKKALAAARTSYADEVRRRKIVTSHMPFMKTTYDLVKHRESAIREGRLGNAARAVGRATLRGAKATGKFAWRHKGDIVASALGAKLGHSAGKKIQQGASFLRKLKLPLADRAADKLAKATPGRSAVAGALAGLLTKKVVGRIGVGRIAKSVGGAAVKAAPFALKGYQLYKRYKAWKGSGGKPSGGARQSKSDVRVTRKQIGYTRESFAPEMRSDGTGLHKRPGRIGRAVRAVGRGIKGVAKAAWKHKGDIATAGVGAFLGQKARKAALRTNARLSKSASRYAGLGDGTRPNRVSSPKERLGFRKLSKTYAKGAANARSVAKHTGAVRGAIGALAVKKLGGLAYRGAKKLYNKVRGREADVAFVAGIQLIEGTPIPRIAETQLMELSPALKARAAQKADYQARAYAKSADGAVGIANILGGRAGEAVLSTSNKLKKLAKRRVRQAQRFGGKPITPVER